VRSHADLFQVEARNLSSRFLGACKRRPCKRPFLPQAAAPGVWLGEAVTPHESSVAGGAAQGDQAASARRKMPGPVMGKGYCPPGLDVCARWSRSFETIHMDIIIENGPCCTRSLIIHVLHVLQRDESVRAAPMKCDRTIIDVPSQ